MELGRKSIGTIGHGFKLPGKGRIILPSGVDRDTFIAQCMRTNTVSITNNNGEYMHGVEIGKNAIQFLRFPENEKELGSPVFYSILPYHNLPVVVEVFNSDDEMLEVEEQQFRIRRESIKGVVELSGKGKKGQLFINVEGKDAENGGQMYVNVTNVDKTALFDLKIAGECLVEVEGDIHIQQTGEFTVEVLDGAEDYFQKFSIKEKKTFIDSPDINLGSEEAAEPLLLGDTTMDLIQEFIDIVSQGKVATLMGPQPFMPDTQAKLIALGEKLETAKSEVVKTN